jgi:hypothetical protein
MLKGDEMNKKFLLVSLLSLILILSAFGPVLQATVFNGDLRVTRDMDVDRNLNVDGKGTIDGLFNLTHQSLTITGGGTITPVSSYVILTPPFEITTSTTLPIATSGIATGTILILRNDHATDSIYVDGTGGTVECTGNIRLEPDDQMALVFSDKWYCLSNFDN